MFIALITASQTLSVVSTVAAETATHQHQLLYLSFIQSHAKQILEPVFRAQRYLHAVDQDIIKTTNEFSASLLELMEKVLPSSQFIQMCVAIQQKLDKNKMVKKVKEKTEFAMNPKAYAMKKVSVTE